MKIKEQERIAWHLQGISEDLLELQRVSHMFSHKLGEDVKRMAEKVEYFKERLESDCEWRKGRNWK